MIKNFCKFICKIFFFKLVTAHTAVQATVQASSDLKCILLF